MSSETSRKRRFSRDAANDPGMVWQSYKSCKQRGEEALANDALFKYTEIWHRQTVNIAHSVRYRLDPHLLPSLAFEETSGEWLLQTRPQGILSCLEELVSHLGTQLTNEGSRKLFGQGGESQEETNKPIVQLPLLMKVLLKIICCSENLVAVSQTKLADTATDICSNCLKVILSRNFDSESSISELLKTMGYCAAIIHILADPQRNWLKGMSQNTLISDNSVMNPVTITRDIVTIINDTYSSLEKLVQGRCEDEYKSLQLEMLHLVGAILSGSRPNAEIVVLSISETLPFTVLEPRDICSPLQVTAIRVLIRMVHVLHCLIPEELLSHIDVRVLLSGLFNVLSPRWNDDELIPPHPELVISILDSFSILCDPPHDSEGLKEILINVAVMEKVCEILNTLKDTCDESQELGLRLCCSIIRAYGCVMFQNIPAQEAFEQRVGYRRFRKLISGVIKPVKEILLELLNLVIEDDFNYPSKETNTIHNTSIVCMLIRWLPSLSPSLRKWLVQNLFELSTTAIHNRQKCCVAGVLRVIVEVLAKSQNAKKYVGKQVEDKLIELVEILGSHSVVAAELKQIIGSLRTTEDGKLPSYYYRLQQALCTMASNKEDTTPLYYFDLRQPGSHIAIPDLRSLPSSNGFTFHVWVCLNVPSSLGRPIQGGAEHLIDDRRKCRRMLYSFHSRSGMGFEAFFTENMNLVVATSTRKEFHAFTIQQPTFRSADWHKITIVNNLGRKWGKNEITVYIDGINVGTAHTKAPSEKRYVYSYIGAHHSAYRRPSDRNSGSSSVTSYDIHNSSNSFNYDPNGSDDESDRSAAGSFTSSTAPSHKVVTVPMRDIEAEWGHPEHLTGLISTVCIFTDRLSPNCVQILHNHPHNDLSLFQPKCESTQELASKVMVYFHPKACKDCNCVNLLAQASGPKYNGIVSGEPYVTWDVKDVLNSLGGMELLFPILENVCIPPKQFALEDGGQRSTLSATGADQYYDEDDGKKEIFNEHQGAAAFIHLLVSMLDGSHTNQEVFFLRQGPATIGALLRKVSPNLLTQQFLSAIQRLTEIFRRNTQNKCYLYEIQKCLLFNFSIWSRPSVDVRKEHIQYLMTIIRDDQEHCRAEFGVEFMLDVLRIHYSKMGCTSSACSEEGDAPLNEEDDMAIRSAIINAMKLYVMNDIGKEEVAVILRFLTACQDSHLLDEILRFLLNLLNTCQCADTLSRYLWMDGSPLIVFVQAENTSVRLLSIKVLSTLIKKHSDINTGPVHHSLQNGALAAAVRHMTVYDIPSSVLLALLELCTAKGSDLTEYISSFPLYMAVLQLLRSVRLVVRHTVCHQFISLLQLNPTHIDNIVSYPAWESLFLWLLCKQDSNGSSRERGASVVDERVNNSSTLPTEDVDHDGRQQRHPPPTSSQSTSQITSHYSYDHWYQYFSEDDDIYRTFAVVTETIGYILWHQINQQEGGMWQTWGHLLAALDEFTGSHPLIVPDFIVKQRLFSLLMNAVRLECNRTGVNYVVLLNTILQLSQLLEVFLVSSYPSCISSNTIVELERSTDIIRGASHSTDLVLDMQSSCVELLNQYLDMLNAAGLLVHEPTMNLDSVKLSILQSALRILLAAIGCKDQKHYSLAATRLLSILHTGALEKQDIVFFLKHIFQALDKCLEHGETDHTHHLIPTLREIFSQYSVALDLNNHLPYLPNPLNGHTFSQEFVKYVEQKEWTLFKEKILVHDSGNYNIVLFPWLSMCLKRRQDCIITFQNNESRRRDRIYIEQDAFQDTILHPFSEHRDEEVQRQKTRDSLCQTDYSTVIRQWKAIKKFFTGERGAWSNRIPDPYVWGLSRTENFSRMRMKTTRLYTSNNHQEAARLRDMAEGGTVNKLQQEDRSLLQKAARTSSLHDDEDDEEMEQSNNNDQLQPEQEGNEAIINREGEEEDADVKEVIVRTEKCDVIVLMEKVSGRLEISNKHIYFFLEHYQPDKMDLLQWYNPEFKIKLNDLREIHSRRFNMARTALELFLVDQTNFFINFQTRKIVRRVYESIVQQKTPNLNRVGIRKPSKLLQTAGLTEKWKRREISNFDYLLQLNTVAGRTYNDLNQYPIFPWVVKDFTSDELDLSNPEIYRDFSLPMGAQNKNKRAELKMKYDEVDDPVLGRFHHGSHYSNAAGVLHYLIRLEPFTTLHIDLQDGRFDVGDRQFISIPTTAANIFKGSGADVKELIPEFYYLPDFLSNVNSFDLGVRRHTDEKINDVMLPPWAKSPEDFIQKHKDALESSYVSDHLHEWIDLIFGYKQSGPEAVKAYNLFLKYSYEENVNLEDMNDETEKRRIEAIINNFGQTPTKLFNEPHVKRWSLEQCKKNPSKGIFVGTRKNHINLFEKLDFLKAYGVDILIGDPNDGGVVFVGTPTIQTRAVLVSGNPEPLVTITGSGLLNVHGWLPFSNARRRPFSFQFDPNSHFDKSRQYIGAPFAQDIAVSHHLFVLSPNNKLLITGGHWDNSFRVVQIDRARLTKRINHHNDIVTCMALDKSGTGEHLVTGSRDTTCVIWKLKQESVSDLPLVTLYGHDHEVLCVDISTELDIVASGDKDGTCIVHTVRGGNYVYTIKPRPKYPCEIRHVAISNQGRILVYSQGPDGKNRSMIVPPCIHLYSINGKLLFEKELAEPLNDLVVVGPMVITGNDKGFLTFRELSSLRQLNSLNLLESIRCISVVLHHQSKICTHLLVGLKNGKLIIVTSDL